MIYYSGLFPSQDLVFIGSIHVIISKYLLDAYSVLDAFQRLDVHQ